MPTVYLAPDPINSTQLIPGGAVPAVGGKLFSYLAGSSTKTNVYTDNTGGVAWSNPIVLDSGGNLGGSNEVWIPAGVSVKFVLAPATDTDPPIAPYKTWDNLSGINDATSILTEWIPGPTPTFVSTTSFTLVGDQTAIFTPGRRVKTTNTAGTRYGTISTSVFGAVTTITITNDSGTLDAGLSAVWYALINPKNTSLPLIVSVLNFGAVGDGVTDDGTAIQVAINALNVAGGGSLLFPRGTYKHATGLTWSDGVNAVGEGKTASILSYTGAGVAHTMTYTGLAFTGLEHRGFRITSLTGTIGISLTTGIGVTFRQVEITGVSQTGFTTAGVKLSPPDGSHPVLSIVFDNCDIHENSGAGISADVLANDVTNHIVVNNSRVRANGGGNIKGTSELLNWVITGNDLEASGATGAISFTDFQGLVIQGNYFEQASGNTAISLAVAVTSNGLSIKGNYIKGSGTGTAITLGASGFAVQGVDISGNTIASWTTGINPVRVVGGTIGPNNFTSNGTDIATPGANCTALQIQQASGVWDFYGTGGAKNARTNSGIAQLVTTYTALSASDVDIALGNSLLLNIRDTTNGGTATVTYENAQTPVILGQAGTTTYVTGAPGAGQIQVKNRGTSGGVAVLANANRNNAVLNVSLIVTQP